MTLGCGWKPRYGDPMKFGFVIPRGDARAAATFAQAAEAAGWDGFFVWEAPWGSDPWICLAAAAMVTERIRLGTMLTPLPIRQPWKLASETATLDHLSNGRLILSVGLGAPEIDAARLALRRAAACQNESRWHLG
jgi:alkanesulfonate monooxygenase SsuD/methylene tetrahydromethanopterin reductase-like flavin-dependent oxidoreductase (luciferase family)